MVFTLDNDILTVKLGISILQGFLSFAVFVSETGSHYVVHAGLGFASLSSAEIIDTWL